MNVNITYSDTSLPLHGPVNPFSDRRRFHNQNALAGHVEEQTLTDPTFKAQHLSYAIFGYSANPSIDPSAPVLAGSMTSAQQNEFATVDMIRISHADRKGLKRKRDDKGTLDVVEGEGAYTGPWTKWEGDDLKIVPGRVIDFSSMDNDEYSDETEAGADGKKSKSKKGVIGQEMSTFHGKNMTDYQGRTYMHPPISDAPSLVDEAGSQQCFIPKVCVHTWTGHTQGVSVIRLFPVSGHLLLSGSMDTKIKVRNN